jgi:hypothetical protein
MGGIPIEVKEKGGEMVTHFCCVFVDGLFLCLWAAINFGVSLAVRNYFPSDGVDAIIGFVLQGLFGIATLAPIAIDIYRDLRVMWIRANRKIAKAAVAS